ncbi:MAG: hypothetical protein AAFX94_14155, partial [Myxococcota bacterium]
MSMKLTLAGFGSLFALFTISCGDECDPNTENRDGVCIARAESTCSEGTQLVAGACIASAEACADGTAFSNGRCEPLTRGCAAGTSFDAARLECISNRQIVCGPGTFQRGTECVRNADGSALDSTVAVEGFGDIALRAPLADGTGPLIVLFHGIYGGVSHRSHRLARHELALVTLSGSRKVEEEHARPEVVENAGELAVGPMGDSAVDSVKEYDQGSGESDKR